MSDAMWIGDHEIVWSLMRVKDPQEVTTRPVAELTCKAHPDSACRHGGPWEADMDPGEFRDGECWATVWIEETGAEFLWMGRDDRQIEGTRCRVWYDGADWVWAYEGEPVAVTPDGGDDVIIGDRIDVVVDEFLDDSDTWPNRTLPL